MATQEKHRQKYLESRSYDAWANECNAAFLEKQVLDAEEKIAEITKEIKDLDERKKALSDDHSDKGRSEKSDIMNRTARLVRARDSWKKAIAGAVEGVHEHRLESARQMSMYEFAKDFELKEVETPKEKLEENATEVREESECPYDECDGSGERVIEDEVVDCRCRIDSKDQAAIDAAQGK